MCVFYSVLGGYVSIDEEVVYLSVVCDLYDIIDCVFDVVWVFVVLIIGCDGKIDFFFIII